MPVDGEVLAAISSEIVRLKAQHYGKGAVEAKTYAADNWLFCVLKGGMTKVEETLIDAGDQELVRAVRLRFQHQMDETFRAAVERLTGRTVLGYESQVLFRPDYTIEMFLLAPEGEAR